MFCSVHVEIYHLLDQQEFWFDKPVVIGHPSVILMSNSNGYTRDVGIYWNMLTPRLAIELLTNIDR